MGIFQACKSALQKTFGKSVTADPRFVSESTLYGSETFTFNRDGSYTPAGSSRKPDPCFACSGDVPPKYKSY